MLLSYIMLSLKGQYAAVRAHILLLTGRADADLCGELAQWASATRFFRLCYDGLQAGAECLEAMGEGSR